MKEASLYERGDRPGLERASIQKLKYKLDSGNNLLGEEVSKQKEVMSGRAGLNASKLRQLPL